MKNNNFYTVQEIATLLGVAPVSIYRSIQNRTIQIPGMVRPCGKRGAVRFYRAAVMEWLRDPTKKVYQS